MREIKFRAYDKKKKKWLAGYDVGSLGGFSLFGEVMLLGEWSHILDTYLMSREGFEPEDLVVMQFTGLKDKNGKEIYEGDVVQTENTVVGQITFYSGHFMLDVGKGVRMYISDEYEVIGNIYQNPELLTP